MATLSSSLRRRHYVVVVVASSSSLCEEKEEEEEEQGRSAQWPAFEGNEAVHVAVLSLHGGGGRHRISLHESFLCKARAYQEFLPCALEEVRMHARLVERRSASTL